MSEPRFAADVARFARDGTLPALPPAGEARDSYFDEAKGHILHRADRDQDVALCLALVEALAARAAEPLVSAWADWCVGLAFLNRDPLRALSAFDLAYQHYQESGRDYEASRVLINRAAMLGQVGQLVEAEQAIRQAQQGLTAYPDYSGWPALYLNLSDIQGRLGRYAEMASSARQAEEQAQRFANAIAEAQALINQAVAGLFLGQVEETEQILRRALRLADACQAPTLSGRALLTLARLQSYSAHLFESLKLLAEARSCFAQAALPLEQATADIEEAALYEQLGMPDEARRAALRAARVLQAPFPNESMEAWLLATRLALAREEPRRARSYLEQARPLLPQVGATFQALWQVMDAHPLLHPEPTDLQQALTQAAAAALSLAHLGAVREHLEAQLVAARLAGHLPGAGAEARYRSLITLAQQQGLPIAEQQAWEGLATHLSPEQAPSALHQAAQLAHQRRTLLPVEALKATLLTDQGTLFRRLVEAHLRVGEERAACEVLLAAKGAIWAEVAAPATPQPPDVAWVQARTALAFWQAERQDATPDSDYARHCTAQVEQAEESLLQVARRQARARPMYPVPALSAVQAALPPASVTLDYLVGEQAIWVCVLRPDMQPRWIQVGERATVAALLRRIGLLCGALQQPGDEARSRAAMAQQPWMDDLLGELYGQLLAPLEPLLPRGGALAIAPDDFLFEVPWAALRAGTSYLVERYALTLVPSASLAALPHLRPPASTPLALGYAADLLHVATELESLRAALPTFRVVFPASREALQLDSAPRYLHLAAHGRVNRQAPLLSSLTLADGPFLLADALTLSLHGTELVTLSACETGSTPERGGVLLALSGAFLSAGAEAVLASLWAVDDAATAQLMGHLYQLLPHHPLPHALQAAQGALLHTAAFRHPYYWAAFQPLCRTLAPSNF